MEIYQNKSRWKIYLAVAALVILAISVMYTNFIAAKLADGERDKVELYVMAMKILAVDTLNVNDQVGTEFAIINSSTIPVIAVDEVGNMEANNFPEGADLEKELAWLKSNGAPPIEGHGYASLLYYKNTRLLTLLQYFPLIQVMLLLGFIGVGYLAFSSARRSEQNRVWVGMAKETAHQLGTPISAIIAWLEHLKLAKGSDDETMEIVKELENDVERLNLVADRFSKIGSEPKLDAINLVEELEKCKIYMQKRAPKRVEFDFPNTGESEFIGKINPPLFDWVVENLLRNALDAMNGTGKISAKIYEESDHIAIDITDTGKGIPSNKLKTVFEPGFTTKKRGWGLGLSLAKRIIESYHSGKIFVKSSILNEGTTFTIKLPKA